MIFDNDETRWLTLFGKQLDCDVCRLKIVQVYNHWAYGVNKSVGSVVRSLEMEAEAGKSF